MFWSPAARSLVSVFWSPAARSLVSVFWLPAARSLVSASLLGLCYYRWWLGWTRRLVFDPGSVGF